jgi:hypothetical protein
MPTRGAFAAAALAAQAAGEEQPQATDDAANGFAIPPTYSSLLTLIGVLWSLFKHGCGLDLSYYRLTLRIDKLRKGVASQSHCLRS